MSSESGWPGRIFVVATEHRCCARGSHFAGKTGRQPSQRDPSALLRPPDPGPRLCLIKASCAQRCTLVESTRSRSTGERYECQAQSRYRERLAILVIVHDVGRLCPPPIGIAAAAASGRKTRIASSAPISPRVPMRTRAAVRTGGAFHARHRSQDEVVRPSPPASRGCCAGFAVPVGCGPFEPSASVLMRRS